ncbi:MAG TPA: oligopeptide/dipeptide ABC transporter ATP-binding protein [Candidatus Acidoferrales bacterium]|nr:oligopeptide/dipeptide ABC transporter ATP-binding protein [Candidatus Acidoferrales bacterium]
MALLEVKNLTKHFDISGGFLHRLLSGAKILKAVDDVSFTVPEGKTFGLVGESGCGKSTTARLITRLVPATAGEVYFEGREVLSLPKREVRELRKHIQMIFQDPYASLNPRMRVADIVGRPLTLFYGLKGQKRLDQVVELLELVGLRPEQLYRYPHEFSGGQRQRIGIARALAAKPKLIIADEPVSSLDVSVQAQVLNLLKKLQRELKLSLIFISHDLNVVGYLADVVAVMYAGKIVEIASAEHIFTAPLHPYTKALLASNPVVGSFTDSIQSPLKGEVSFPVNPPPGCRLEPRCPIRVGKCKTVAPPLEEKKPARLAACHEV